jgi:glucose uptake protein GlcU
MQTPFFLAQLIGPLFITFGLAMLLNQKYYRKIVRAMANDTTFQFLGGIASFTIGLAIVLSYHAWSQSWEVIITILGWVAIIKGTLLLISPESMQAFAKAAFKNDNWIVQSGVFYIILGGALFYFGYFSLI